MDENVGLMLSYTFQILILGVPDHIQNPNEGKIGIVLGLGENCISRGTGNMRHPH